MPPRFTADLSISAAKYNYKSSGWAYGSGAAQQAVAATPYALCKGGILKLCVPYACGGDIIWDCNVCPENPPTTQAPC